MNTAGNMMNTCAHCGMYHPNGVCPRIKAIEYWPNGTMKRVEYHATVPERAEPTIQVRGLYGET